MSSCSGHRNDIAKVFTTGPNGITVNQMNELMPQVEDNARRFAIKTVMETRYPAAKQ